MSARLKLGYARCVSGLFGFAWSEWLVLAFVGVFVVWPLVRRVCKRRRRSR